MNLIPSHFFNGSKNNKNWLKLWYGLRIGYNIFMKRSVLSHASVCGYSTILALIPILIISISIVEVFSGPDKDEIFDFVVNYFLPGMSDPEEIIPNTLLPSNQINESTPSVSTNTLDPDTLFNTDGTPTGALGNTTSAQPIHLSEAWMNAKKEIIRMIQQASNLRIISAVFLIVACVGVFNSIEFAFNEIWMVHKRRTLFKQFLAFWLLLTMTPILLGLSAYFTIQVKAYTEMGDVKLYEFVLNYIISFLFTFMAFLFANRYMPNVPVHLYPAMVGSFLSAFLWETAKHAIGLYMNYSINLQNGFYSIYSSLVLIPVFIVWLYYSYLCFLMGPVIATTIQDYDQHAARLHRKRNRKDHLPLYTFRVFFLICAHFHYQKSGMPFDELAKLTGWNVLRLRGCINELIRIELIHTDPRKHLYFPNSDPSAMSLRETLESVLGLRHPNMEQIKQDEEWINEVERHLSVKPSVSVLDMILEEVQEVSTNGSKTKLFDAAKAANRV